MKTLLSALILFTSISGFSQALNNTNSYPIEKKKYNSEYMRIYYLGRLDKALAFCYNNLRLRYAGNGPQFECPYCGFSAPNNVKKKAPIFSDSL